MQIRDLGMSVLAVGVLAVFATPAWAQPVAKAEESGQILSIVVALGLTCAMFAISFKTAKRGHQD